MTVSTIPTRAVHALATQGRSSETAFQAVLVAVARALQRAVGRVRGAEASALNFAQQQKVARVANDLAATAEALEEALNDQGRCLLDGPRTLREKMKDAGERVRATLAQKPGPAAASWWFALAEAVEALDEAAEQVHALAEAQPVGTPAVALVHEVVVQLDAHREALLAEAERWVG